MSTCPPRNKRSKRNCAPKESLDSCRSSARRRVKDSLRAIVQDYLRDNARGEQRLLDYYRLLPGRDNAITKAAMAELPSGKRFGHQWRIPGSALRKAARRLVRVNLESARSFEELHQLISETINDIRGIGELMIYDTAHRIGARLELRPQHVYLHAGVRDGAKALRLNHCAEKLSMRELPPELRRLSPGQVEDCLCIYKTRLKKLMRN
jgi:hypothetical protein